MKKFTCIVFALFIMFAAFACEPTFDSSSDEAFTESVLEVRDSIQDSTITDEDLAESIVLVMTYEAYRNALEDDVDPRDALDGMTAEDVVKRAQDLERRMNE